MKRAHFHFALSFFSSSPATLGQLSSRAARVPPPPTPPRPLNPLRHGQMSDTVAFHCFPACCAARWSLTRVLTSRPPNLFFSSFFCKSRQCFPAASPAHARHAPWASVSGGRRRRRWRRRLSHSCSGFDPSPLTSDPSHRGQAAS